MAVLSQPSRPKLIPSKNVPTLLVGISAMGWLVMAGMVWDLGQIMPVAELGPGMAWFSGGRFADYEASGVTRFIDALCITGADPRAMLSNPLHIVAMWLAMAVAMMTPVAFPDLKAQLARSDRTQVFCVWRWMLGFWAVWALVAICGAILQGGLFAIGILGDGMIITAAPLSGFLLFLAGAYQFTARKSNDRRSCQVARGTPAMASGWSAGWQSLRCCWALMLAMFALGVMNIVAAGVLTLFMVSERSHKAGNGCSQIGGALLVTFGVIVFAAG